MKAGKVRDQIWQKVKVKSFDPQIVAWVCLTIPLVMATLVFLIPEAPGWLVRKVFSIIISLLIFSFSSQILSKSIIITVKF